MTTHCTHTGAHTHTLHTAHCTHTLDHTQVLKRLHTAPDKRERKDACKPHGRLLAKIAAATPLPCMETIVQLVSFQ